MTITEANRRLRHHALSDEARKPRRRHDSDNYSQSSHEDEEDSDSRDARNLKYNIQQKQKRKEEHKLQQQQRHQAKRDARQAKTVETRFKSEARGSPDEVYEKQPKRRQK